MSPRRRMLAGFLAAGGIIVVVVVSLLALGPVPPPQIQGVLLADARPLAAFRLTDHEGNSFSNADLIGDWHLVTYGFTTCPDVCPATLSELQQFSAGARAQRREAPRVLFYSVDHRRDTPEQLANYLPYFKLDITGLTHGDDPANPHLAFEQSLGIMAELIPTGGPDSSDYKVSHGLHLFLLNPAGELQAIFEPSARPGGQPFFEPRQLVQDYLAIRSYQDRLAARN